MSTHRTTTAVGQAGLTIDTRTQIGLTMPTLRLCRQCGAEVPRGAKRCTHCGQPLSFSRRH